MWSFFFALLDLQILAFEVPYLRGISLFLKQIVVCFHLLLILEVKVSDLRVINFFLEHIVICFRLPLMAVVFQLLDSRGYQVSDLKGTYIFSKQIGINFQLPLIAVVFLFHSFAFFQPHVCSLLFDIFFCMLGFPASPVNLLRVFVEQASIAVGIFLLDPWVFYF